MLFDLPAHDFVPFGAGVAMALAGVAMLGAVHKAAPAVKAWFTQEKASVLGLEERVATGFATVKNAVINGDTKLRSDFQGVINGLHMRLVAVEKLVGIPAVTPPTAAPVASPPATTY